MSRLSSKIILINVLDVFSVLKCLANSLSSSWMTCICLMWIVMVHSNLLPGWSSLLRKDTSMNVKDSWIRWSSRTLPLWALLCPQEEEPIRLTLVSCHCSSLSRSSSLMKLTWNVFTIRSCYPISRTLKPWRIRPSVRNWPKWPWNCTRIWLNSYPEPPSNSTTFSIWETCPECTKVFAERP